MLSCNKLKFWIIISTIIIVKVGLQRNAANFLKDDLLIFFREKTEAEF